MIFALLLLLFAPAGEADLRNAEKSWAAAVVARDFAALDRIYDDTLIYAHATGRVETKKEYLDRLRAGTQQYASIQHETVRVALHGDSAVTHSIVRLAGTTAGKPFNDHVMMLHAWVKKGGTWRLAGHQTAKID